MSKHDKYLTFPIALMQLGKSLDDVTTKEAADRIRAIVPWCLREATLQNLRDLESDNGKLQAIAERHPNYDYTDGTEEDVAFLAAQDTLGWNVPHFKYARHAASQLETSVAMSAGKKLSRVRSDIIAQVLDGKMKWRDFSVLVAICAGCFDKTKIAVKLTMEQIGAMALGYGTAKYLHTHDAESLTVSDKAIGRTVEKLRQRGWFVKLSPDNGRTTFYSNSLSESQMITYVTKVKAGRIQKKKRSLRDMQQEVQTGAEQLARLTVEQRRQLEDLNKRLHERRANG